MRRDAEIVRAGPDREREAGIVVIGVDRVPVGAERDQVRDRAADRRRGACERVVVAAAIKVAGAGRGKRQRTFVDAAGRIGRAREHRHVVDHVDREAARAERRDVAVEVDRLHDPGQVEDDRILAGALRRMRIVERIDEREGPLARALVELEGEDLVAGVAARARRQRRDPICDRDADDVDRLAVRRQVEIADDVLRAREADQLEAAGALRRAEIERGRAVGAEAHDPGERAGGAGRSARVVAGAELVADAARREAAFVDDADRRAGFERDIRQVGASVVAGRADLLERQRVGAGRAGHREGIRRLGAVRMNVGDLVAVPEHLELGRGRVRGAGEERKRISFARNDARHRLRDRDVARRGLEVDHLVAIRRVHAEIAVDHALELDDGAAADRRGLDVPARHVAVRREAAVPRRRKGAAGEVAVLEQVAGGHRNVVGDRDVEVLGERDGVPVEVDRLDEAREVDGRRVLALAGRIVERLEQIEAPRAVAVDGEREHAVAVCIQRGQRRARDRRLVDGKAMRREAERGEPAGRRGGVDELEGGGRVRAIGAEADERRERA